MSCPEKWLPRPPGVPKQCDQTKLRVFCVPAAGMGGWTCFQAWLGELPEGTELMPLELPGRMLRSAEKPPFAKSLQDLANQAVEGIGFETFSAQPFVLFGHSFGAWLVYEIYHELARRAWPLPKKVYVSAARGPNLAGSENDPDRICPKMGRLDSAEFWHAFERRYGQNPDLTSSFIRDMVRTTIQADFDLLENYVPSTLEPLSVPLCAVCASGDGRCHPEQLSAWNKVASAGFCERWFNDVLVPGGWANEHRYIIDNPEQLLRFLCADLPIVGHGELHPGTGVDASGCDETEADAKGGRCSLS